MNNPLLMEQLQTLLEIKRLLNIPEDTKLNLVCNPEINGCKKQNQGVFTLWLNSSEVIARFTLVQLQGCCGVCVSTDAWVAGCYRNRGIGKLLNRYRILTAKEWGYGALICTDIDSNKHQNSILRKNNWSKIASFINPRTGNKVNIHFINLNPRKGFWTRLVEHLLTQ